MGKNKKIFMAAANYWQSPFQVGSHHLARGFVQEGWEVAFVSDPISPWHTLAGVTAELKDRFFCYRAGGRHYFDNKLWAYVPAALLVPHNKPLLRSSPIARYWSKLSFPNIVSKVKQNGFLNVDMLYLDSAVQSFWLKVIKCEKSVFRMADNSSGFSKSTPALQKLEKELIDSVDAVAYTANTLAKRAKATGVKNNFYLANGVDFSHFAKFFPIPSEYQKISKPIAIYSGSLNEWFDYRLVCKVAQKLKDVSFVLIGPDKLARAKLPDIANIHILGSRPYRELPGYLQHANVGIIPFNVAKYPQLIHSVNPLKLYEYMACGLPVVSVRWQELVTLNSPALLCTTPEEFAEGITNAIYNPLRKQNIRYAKTQDWSNRIVRLLEEMGFANSP